MWEIEIDGRVEGPFDTATARRMMAERPPLRAAPIRMAEADPEAPESGPGPWRLPADFGFDRPAPGSEDAPWSTRGLERRAVWLRGALLALIVASAALSISSVVTLRFLAWVRGGADGAGQAEILSQAESIDLISSVIGVAFLATLIAAVTSYCFWVNRAARHARELSPEVMTISPDWAVGWAFVPIANLWMPFKAMSQIWRATAQGGGGALSPSIGLLWVWWPAYLISNALSNASFRIDMQGDNTQIETSLGLGVAADAFEIVACVALMAVVARVTAAQRAWDPAKAFE